MLFPTRKILNNCVMARKSSFIAWMQTGKVILFRHLFGIRISNVIYQNDIYFIIDIIFNPALFSILCVEFRPHNFVSSSSYPSDVYPFYTNRQLEFDHFDRSFLADP